MNALILAQHHGAFMTIESCLGKFERIVVAVPKSQIEKYAGFPEQVFKDYEKNLRAYCKKHKIELYVVNSPTDNHLSAYINMLREINGTGKWATISAGSIFQSFDESKLNSFWFGLCTGRVFDGDDRLSMYGMLGHAPIVTTPVLNNHFLNLDLIPPQVWRDAALLNEANNKGKQRKLAGMAIGRADVLIGQAISAIELNRVRYKTFKSAILSYWMESIKRNHPESFYLAYPFDEYARYAKKVKKYLPAPTYEIIVENGAQSARYREIVELDL